METKEEKKEIKKRNTWPRWVRQSIPITSWLRKFTLVPIIDPLCYYTVNNILELWLLPNMKKCQEDKIKLWKLITYREDWLVYPKLETNEFWMKPVDTRKIWNKTPRYKVQWAEIIKFLRIHKLLPE